MLLNSYTLIEKKSKFIALLYEVKNQDDVKKILENIKKEHKKARHNPYAYIIDKKVYKTDDKEPSGTAGLPILNVLMQENLNYHLLVVVRYFGGTKLGTGPLYRAYALSARTCVKNYNLNTSVGS